MLMPGVMKYSLTHLYAIMNEYVNKTVVCYEYALSINDSDNEIAGPLRLLPRQSGAR